MSEAFQIITVGPTERENHEKEKAGKGSGSSDQLEELEALKRQYQEQQEQARRNRAEQPGARGAPESRPMNQHDFEVFQAEDDNGCLLYKSHELAFLALAIQYPVGVTQQYNAMTEGDRMRLLYSGQFMKKYGQTAKQWLKLKSRESSFSTKDILQMLLSVPLAARMLAHNLVMTAQQASSQGSERLVRSLQDFLLNKIGLPNSLALAHAQKIAVTYQRNPGDAKRSLPPMLTVPELAPYVLQAAILARNDLVAQAMAAAEEEY